MPVTEQGTAAPLLALDEIANRLDQALAASPADATEIVWLESRLGEVSSSRRHEDEHRLLRRNVEVRVIDRCRSGVFRTESSSVRQIEDGIRLAVAQSRAVDRQQPKRRLLRGKGATPDVGGLFDPELTRLTAKQARHLLRRSKRSGERARLRWGEHRVLVVNSRHLHCRAATTSCTLEVRSGRGPGAARSVMSGRSLAAVDPDAVFERARSRAPGARAGQPDEVGFAAPPPVVLAAEAVVRLVNLLNAYAFTSEAFRPPDAFLRDRLDQTVFAPSIQLLDDGSRDSGLPFPFDFEGRLRRPIPLIEDGMPRTPAIDLQLASELRRAPTPHFVTLDLSRADHLFLGTGELAESELVQTVEDGLWIGDLARPEIVDAGTLELRAAVKGGRRIRGGRLAEPTGPLVWQDSLVRLFSEVEAIGRDAAVVGHGESGIGATSAPSLAIAGGGRFDA